MSSSFDHKPEQVDTALPDDPKPAAPDSPGSQPTAQMPGAGPQPGVYYYLGPQGGYAYAGPLPGGAYPPVPYPFAPPVAYGPPPFQRPDPHWGWVVGAFICFWPLAIAACINAANVDSSWLRGDWHGARRASEEAERFGKIGVWVGVGLTALSIIVMVIYFIILFSFLTRY